MAVRQAELKQHFIDLGNNGAIYVWGANGQTITQELVDKLFKSFGNSKYNRKYYDNKLKEGEGKPGADCSGAIKPMSGYDTTATGYYNHCVDKGDIAFIPTNKVCLVFKKNSSGRITHVGCYTADGYVSEMASSKLNYQRKPLKNNGWDLWGMPDFISDRKTTFLDTDGSWGKDTTTKSQEVYGTTVDGIISNQKMSCKKYVPGADTKSWKFNIFCTKGSTLIKAIQTDLKAKSYYTDKIDGWCGKGTVTAIQKFLKDLGYYTGKIDGSMGKQTVIAWQKYINSKL